MATADLPAKALLMNMNQYNGKYPCAHCEHEGVPRALHLLRDWPYQKYPCAHCEHEGVPRALHLLRDWPYQKYPCAHCEHEGVPRALHLLRDWPYQENLQSRTHFSMIDLSKKSCKRMNSGKEV